MTEWAKLNLGESRLATRGCATCSWRSAALDSLYLYNNKIGYEGLRHLGDAARGAAPAELWLSENQIGDEGMRHLIDILARGAAPRSRRSTSGATRSATRGCAT